MCSYICTRLITVGIMTRDKGSALCVRMTRTEDIPEVLHLYDEARLIMRADGNMHQWANGYPNEESLRRDISRGVSYVIGGPDGLVGTFAFIPDVEPTYLRIDGGRWLDDTRPYATIHRLASTRDSHGVAKACFDWAWGRLPNLRIDTHRDNNVMQHCILKAGFTYCGIIYLADGDERLAYQKV